MCHATAGCERRDRDREVMRLVALGYTNTQIGEHVGLSGWQVQRIVSKVIKHTNQRGHCFRLDSAILLNGRLPLPWQL